MKRGAWMSAQTKGCVLHIQARTHTLIGRTVEIKLSEDIVNGYIGIN